VSSKRPGSPFDQSPNSSTINLPPFEHERARQNPAVPFANAAQPAPPPPRQAIPRSSQAFRTALRHLTELAGSDDDGIGRFMERRVSQGALDKDDVVRMRGILSALVGILDNAASSDRDALREAFVPLDPIARTRIDG